MFGGKKQSCSRLPEMARKLIEKSSKHNLKVLYNPTKLFFVNKVRKAGSELCQAQNQV